MIVLFLAVLLLAAIVIFYLRLNLIIGSAVMAGLIFISSHFALIGMFATSVAWIVFLVVAVLLNIPFLRRTLISNQVLIIFKKLMPPISQTEREALDAGTIWWEGDLFAGNPNWKKLHSFPVPTLTAEEKSFLDNETEELCSMIDDYKITSELYDLPENVWDFIKKKKFFGMIIPKEHGGLDFSALGHSEVIMKIASRSTTAAVTVMVPNSLGPAELLMHYGTKEQKDYYLPRLADGTDVPCFALTSPEAGSDAGSMPDVGYVEKGTFNGEEVVGIRLTVNKRYITLSSVATVMGVAFRLFDPKGLLGGKEDIGITVALVPTDVEGIEVGPRHDPTGTPFINGTVRCKDVFIPVSFIVGGAENVGKGWRMLMERLAIGRSISLPALSVAAAKLASRATGGYARVRQQFKLPVGKFEGVEEALTRIAGNTYLMEAGRRMTLAAVDSGERPALVSAISKYNLTERMRKVVNDAMDVQGGGAIVLGPSNFMGTIYQGIPVSITVEGANILTRTLIVFGQGIIRAHPFVLKEMESAFDEDSARGKVNFDKALFGHIGFTASSKVRAFVSALTFGVLMPAPLGSRLKKYYKRLGWMSAAFSFASDVSLLVLGGDLKRKEKISGRFADVLSNLYLATAALKRFEDEGKKKEDLPLVEWSCEESLYNIQEALAGIFDNMPNKLIALSLKMVIFPLGKPFKAPSDRLGHKVASVLMEPSQSRDRLTEGIYVPTSLDEPLGRIEDALSKVIASEPMEKVINKAVRSGAIKAFNRDEQIEEALKVGVITQEQKDIVVEGRKARLGVITVDEFPMDYWSSRYK